MIERLLTRFVKEGRLDLITWRGRRIRLGQPQGQAAPLVIRLKDFRITLKIAILPELYLGEAYMDGRLLIERGSLSEFLDFCGRNLALRQSGSASFVKGVARVVLRPVFQLNSRRAARRNVAHHYDLSEEMFRDFLDVDMQYSCAYFARPELSLDEAQAAKKQHIIDKLLIKDGQRVLDIGCGWGGMALSIASTASVDVTGISLSHEQLDVANGRAAKFDLGDRVKFGAQDYREVEGLFERIVSVGMLEHVGAPNYRTYFNRVADLLTDNGVAVIHAIGRIDGPGLTNPWTRKYIFPGGYIPALSEVLQAVEKSGLWVTDIEILRLHYAKTLRAWRERFVQNWDQISAEYDERFCRMWEFYLASSEMSFRYNGLMVFQLQLAKRVDTVPLTRDYLYPNTDDPRVAQPESGKAPRLHTSNGVVVGHSQHH